MMSARQFNPVEFTWVESISEKGFLRGHVCLAWLKDDDGNGRTVIVKSLRQSLAEKADRVMSSSDAKAAAQYRYEADRLRGLGEAHQSFIKFHGYALHKDSKGRLAALLVSEFHPCLGPVLEVIEAADKIGKPITFAIKTYWIWRLLKVMKYLRDQDVLNGNLKSSNVFITEDFTIKVSDYAAIRWYDLHSLAHPLLKPRLYDASDPDIPIGVNSLPDSPMKQFKESMAYMTLQRLQGVLTPAGDLYSYGVTCWEISAGTFVDLRGIYKRILTEHDPGVIMNRINSSFNFDQLPGDTPQEVKALIRATGVGKMDEKRFSCDVNDLCVEFEKQLAVIAVKLKRDEEVSALKTINLATSHSDRIGEALSRQKTKIPPIERMASAKTVVSPAVATMPSNIHPQISSKNPTATYDEGVFSRPYQNPGVHQGQSMQQMTRAGASQNGLSYDTFPLHGKVNAPLYTTTSTGLYDSHSSALQANVVRPTHPGSYANASNPPVVNMARAAVPDIGSHFTQSKSSRGISVETIQRDPSLNLNNDFQHLVVNPNMRPQVRQQRPNLQRGPNLPVHGGGLSVKIMAQQMVNTTFIQDSIVNINGDKTNTKSLKEPTPLPPPFGVLTQSQAKIQEDDKHLFIPVKISLEKQEKLAEHLGLSPGAMSELKTRYESDGLSELCQRLLDDWEEKENGNATKARLAKAVWMIGETELAKKII